MINTREPRDRVPLSEQALDDVRFLREAVERNTQVTSLSPGGLLVAGIAGLSATFASVLWDGAKPAFAWAPPQFTVFFVVWACGLALAASANLAGMRVRSHKQGTRFRSSAFRSMLASLTAPLLAGGVASFWALWHFPGPWLQAMLWLSFYGLALIAAAAHTIGAVRLLGWGSLAVAGILLAVGPGAGSVGVAAALGMVFGAGHLLLAVHVGGRYGW